MYNKKSKIILLVSLFSLTSQAFISPALGRSAISNAWEMEPLILNDLQGDPQNLYQWQGQVILLNFWATWCAPCQVEIPDFIDYQSRYADHGLQIIGVGLDEIKKLKNFVRTTGINYPILHAAPERHYSLLKKWGNSYGVLPFSVVIDRDGRFVYMQQGILSERAFQHYVEPLLTQR